MAAHVSTHRTGEMGKGVYKRGQWITENPVWSTREKRHKDPKPCRQNPACVEQESRWLQQEAGSSERGCCPPHPSWYLWGRHPYITVTMGRGAHKDSTSKIPSSW